MECYEFSKLHSFFQIEIVNSSRFDGKSTFSKCILLIHESWRLVLMSNMRSVERQYPAFPCARTWFFRLSTRISPRELTFWLQLVSTIVGTVSHHFLKGQARKEATRRHRPSTRNAKINRAHDAPATPVNIRSETHLCECKE